VTTSKLSAKRLAAAIKANGLLNPIALDDQGVLIDGRNRLEACRRAGIQLTFQKLNGVDPVAFILSSNVDRTSANTLLWPRSLLKWDLLKRTKSWSFSPATRASGKCPKKKQGKKARHRRRSISSIARLHFAGVQSAQGFSKRSDTHSAEGLDNADLFHATSTRSAPGTSKLGSWVV
jgi:hypothetical protein